MDLSGWNVTKIFYSALYEQQCFYCDFTETFPRKGTVIAQGDVSRYPQWTIAIPLLHHQTSGGKHCG